MKDDDVAKVPGDEHTCKLTGSPDFVLHELQGYGPS